MASNGGRPWFSEDGEGMSPFEGGGAKVEEEELVGVVVDDGAAEGDEAGVFWRGEFAEEQAELDVFAVVFEDIEEAGTAFIVCDVVGAEVDASGHGSADDWAGPFGDIASEPADKEPCLDAEDGAP
jgi:hypothetical protein